MMRCTKQYNRLRHEYLLMLWERGEADTEEIKELDEYEALVTRGDELRDAARDAAFA